MSKKTKKNPFIQREGVFIALLFWRCEKTSNSKLALQKYCEYLSMRKYGKSGEVIFSELECKDLGDAVDWIKETYVKYVTNYTDFSNYIRNGVKYGQQ